MSEKPNSNNPQEQELFRPLKHSFVVALLVGVFIGGITYVMSGVSDSWGLSQEFRIGLSIFSMLVVVILRHQCYKILDWISYIF
ncbi:hypothetical protein OAO01_02180 [Oligoflexia bacterium]|nr:hypothetical protein [Oligoflexia bacterium]